MGILRDVLQFLCGPPGKKPRPFPPQQSLPATTKEKGRKKPPRRSPHFPSISPQEGVPVRQLQAALGLASKVITVRSSLPILSCCLLGHGKLIATDLENYLTIDLPALTLEPVCVPVVQLHRVLRTLKGAVQLEKRSLDLVVQDICTLPGLDPQEFPASPARAVQEQIGETFVVPERWAALLPALSRDHTRLSLTGVCLDLAAGYCVSSDGHRLHALKVPAGAGAAHGIVPLAAAKLLACLLAQGTVAGQLYTQCLPLTKEQEELLAMDINDETPSSVRRKRAALQQELARPRYACFRTAGLELWTRLVDGEFPDYHAVLQRPAKLCPVTLPRAPLLAALKACLACAPKDRLGVSLTRLVTGMRIRLAATDQGSVARLIECTGWTPGRYVGLNARYLLEAVEPVQHRTVTLLLKSHDTPVFLDDGAFQAVLMPLRVAEPPECQRARSTQPCANQESSSQPRA
jgi:DNA polymerase III sliding clamp (beta) subunit (PCNA family)